MPSLRLVVAACRTVAAYLFVSLWTAAVGPPGMILALVFRWPNVLYQLAIIGVRGALLLTGLRYAVEGADYIQRHRAAIYFVNHSSNVEPPLLFLALRKLFPRFQILYKAEIHKIPILAHGFDIVGFVPIERGNRERSEHAINQAATQIREGNSFLVFPEGTRSRTGELLPFRKGVFVMALRAQAPMVPTAITGAREAMRKGSFVIWPVTVRIRFGPPVETAGLTMEDRDSLVAECRAKLLAMLEAARSE
jgi:1-acyl-sn-glycerol-3-phosphate acyltransferase